MQRSHLLPDVPYEWVWELKYIKETDLKKATKKTVKKTTKKVVKRTTKKESLTNNPLVKATRESAFVQLAKYRDSEQFAGRTDVRYASIIFIGKDKYDIAELV
jgi:AMMECR1 domain-containing protein